MKKIIFLAVILSLFCCVSAYGELYNSAVNNPNFVSIHAPYYVQYYNIDVKNMTAKFNPLSDSAERSLTGLQRETYKKTKKIERAISENNFPKAVKEDGDFLPTHIQYYNYFLDKQDFQSALNEMINIIGKSGKPRFVKNLLKPKTITKYKSIAGNFFGLPV